MGDLTEFFSRSEFACKDGCGFDDIDVDLVKKLNTIRKITGLPLIVNSGCRCSVYNEKVGGVKESEHLEGKAADIKVIDSRFRYVFILNALPLFNRIGIYKTFIHVGNSEKKPPSVIWVGK